ncbi:MAG: response regulator [Rhodospirillales bacterium]|nr:response regulator [Rhodospirillales bacterium]
MARILLIEDEEFTRFSLLQILESGGHDVFEASDGGEGISEFQNMVDGFQPPEVVVTDILMPTVSGYEVIKKLREISPGAKIIVISGGGGKDPSVFLNISSSLGADHVLAKPFMPEKLLEAVDHCLA